MVLIKKKKLIVLGLDGAHFELIDRWIKKKELPNIENIYKNGIAGDLRSCLPPVTSPNWKCYSTGKNPAKLGIFWWENIDLKNKKVFFPKDRINKEKEIWDYLGKKGFKVCIIGTPLTYPPKKVNGIMISGGLDCLKKGYTYPLRLEEELKKKFNYKTHPKNKQVTDKKNYINEVYEIIKSRFDVALYLLDKDDFDFMQITTFYINVLQHFFWDREIVKDAWKIIDEYVGKFLKIKDINMILMSDHGSNKINFNFNINTWLEKQNYLILSSEYKIASSVSKIGINKNNLLKILNYLQIDTILKNKIPQSIKNKIPKNKNVFEKESKTKMIDWQNSAAVASGQGPLYIIDKSKKEEILTKISNLKDPNGNKIVNNVYRKEEIYNGNYLSEAPDLILDQSRNIHISGGIGHKEIFEKPKIWNAENKSTGIFLAFGPIFNNNLDYQQLSILDLAPTILHIFDIEKPKR